MTGEQWLSGRRSAGLTQVEASAKLGISQPYLSQLEKGLRIAGPALSRRAAALYRLPPTALPLSESEQAEVVRPDAIENELAGLGYPGFAHTPHREDRNPAQVVLSAVSQRDLDVRLVEALPWVLSRYTDLDWAWLRDRVKLANMQNRLGYLVSLAKRVAARREERAGKLEILSAWEEEMEQARLAGEGTLCRDSMPQSERSWVKSHRPAAAKHWNLLTTLKPENLPYAGD